VGVLLFCFDAQHAPRIGSLAVEPQIDQHPAHRPITPAIQHARLHWRRDSSRIAQAHDRIRRAAPLRKRDADPHRLSAARARILRRA
jgi:hypothetical protein